MIEYSRKRRKSRVKEFACEHCEYKSPSKTLLKRQTNTAHDFTCEQCNVITNQYKKYISLCMSQVLTNSNVSNVTTYQCQKHF